MRRPWQQHLQDTDGSQRVGRQPFHLEGAVIPAGSSMAKDGEPWGQRRVQLAGPGGPVIELVQPVEPDREWVAAQGLSA